LPEAGEDAKCRTRSRTARAPALDKGLDILELLAATDGGLNQAEIAKRLGRSHNELYRMLNTLVRRGYVARDEGDRFSLTLKLFGLAHLHAPVRRMASYATPMMRELAQARSRPTSSSFDRGSVVLIAQQERRATGASPDPHGSHVSLFDTGSGQVLRLPSARGAADDGRRAPATGEEPSIARACRPPRRDQGARLRDDAEHPDQRRDEPSVPVLRPDGRALAALTVPYVHSPMSLGPRYDGHPQADPPRARLSLLAGADVPGQGPPQIVARTCGRARRARRAR
jgi:DNA-binding IclR family transcriptional regulator